LGGGVLEFGGVVGGGGGGGGWGGVGVFCQCVLGGGVFGPRAQGRILVPPFPQRAHFVEL